jgi:hypothetical protein
MFVLRFNVVARFRECSQTKCVHTKIVLAFVVLKFILDWHWYWLDNNENKQLTFVQEKISRFLSFVASHKQLTSVNVAR